MLRPILVILAAILAAAPALAQKPGDDPAPAQWRAQALPLCTSALASAESLTPADRATICGCAADRYLDTHQTTPLVAIDAANLATELGGRILACTAQEQPQHATAVARWLAAQPPIAPPAAAEPPIVPDAIDKPAADAGEEAAPPPRDGVDLSGWWQNLRQRIANSGLPLWAWVLIVTFILLFLRGLTRRRDRSDLTGPPRR